MNSTIKYSFVSIFRPLVPLSSAVVSKYTGLDIITSFSVVNALFTFGLIVFFYKYVIFVFNDTNIAVYSSILLILSVPMLLYSASILVDTASWFFIISSLYLYKKYRSNKKLFLLIGLYISLGILSKEIVFLVLLYVFLEEIIQKDKEDFIKRLPLL